MINSLLAKELKRFYVRAGNRVLFENGMSLNQIAFELWEKEGFQGIDPSVISRLINGERLISFKQLEDLAVVLKIDEDNKKRLKEALLRDFVDRAGVDRQFFESRGDTFINLAEDSFLNIEKVKCSDNIFYKSCLGHLKERIIQKLPTVFDAVRRKRLLNLLDKVVIGIG